ncbi:MAG: LptF/LptG family permease [Planctomycetes bacterium]|nr:LptF/LptG family permease [Planctomycetota bacterium]
MWRIHRYFLREIATNTTLAFSILFGIVLLASVSRGIKRAEGFTALLAAKITLFWTADALPQLLPMSMLFATVLTFARASEDRELVAMRSAGVRATVPLAAATLAGVAVALVSCFLLHWVVPRMHYLKHHAVAAGLRTVLTETGMLGDRVRFEGVVMCWDRRLPDGSWEGVQILVSRDREELGPIEPGLLLADRAWVELDQDRLGLVLENARDVAQRYLLPRELRITVDVRAMSEVRRRDEGDLDLTSPELLAEVYRGVSPDASRALYTCQRRTCFALLPLLLAPIGFCLGAMSRGRGRVLAMVFALAPIAVFFAGDVLGSKLARATSEPLCAWTPALALLLVAVPLCWRQLDR